MKLWSTVGDPQGAVGANLGSRSKVGFCAAFRNDDQSAMRLARSAEADRRNQVETGQGSNVSKPKCWSLFFKVQLINSSWKSTKLFTLSSGSSSHRGKQKSLGSTSVRQQEQLLTLDKREKVPFSFSSITQMTGSEMD